MECSLPLAASAPPSRARVTGITFASITVEWEEVPCEHRNAEITHYLGRIASSDSSMRAGSLVNADTLTITFTGLIARNNYTIQVHARHEDLSFTNVVLTGPPAVIVAVSGVPPGSHVLSLYYDVLPLV